MTASDSIWFGLTVPFVGTALGAGCVWFMKGKKSHGVESGGATLMQKSLTGFAAGVMVAAAIWSLLIPSIDMARGEGLMSVVPAATGFAAGIAFLLILDNLIPHQHAGEESSEGPRSKLSRTAKLVLAVTLHNIPEGMAVGVAFAGVIADNSFLPEAAAIALATGMAIQNFPEGAIISMPLRTAGNSRRRSFALGVLSGLVEPAAMAVTLLVTDAILPLLPYVLSFSAGAMMYVVVEELVPQTQEGRHSNFGTIGFGAGFILMMVLDVALG